MYSKVSDLKDVKIAEEQLNLILRHGKTEDFLFELYNVAIAQGFLAVAEKSGLNRESLYKILQPHSKPYLETIIKILNAMGFELLVREIKRNNLSHKINITRLNSLTVQNPDISSEWHDLSNGILTSSDVTPTSRKKVFWQCKKGHSWCDLVVSRVNGKGCPFCAAINVLEKLDNAK